jgi:hypothetical protein
MCIFCFAKSTFFHAGEREKKYFFHAVITFFHAGISFFHAAASSVKKSRPFATIRVERSRKMKCQEKHIFILKYNKLYNLYRSTKKKVVKKVVKKVPKKLSKSCQKVVKKLPKKCQN